ncbi:MAG: hypothetical protein ACXABN_18180 [Candidatus Thorarchaeota archaeon]|jgi:hypothetical protein
MGLTQKIAPEEYMSTREWTWQASPLAIRIIEKETYHLLYSIQPVTQENLVLVSYWVEEHNRLIQFMRDALTEVREKVKEVKHELLAKGQDRASTE